MIKYPFTINDLMNTDALAKAILMLQEEVKNFVVTNTIKYADPIQWNITTQYERNTVVIDPLTGTAYISVQPVPMGVSLANTDYWTVVFNLSEFVTRAARNFSLNYEENTTLTATFPTVKGGWLVWNDTLYVANVNITPGDQYVDELGGNITRITMESIIGNMDDLLTTHKDNMVNIINEVYGAYTTLDTIIGDMASLDIPDVTSVIAALNVLYTAVNNIANAIIEINGDIGDLDNLNTTDKTSIVAAINEVLSDTNDVDSNVGDLDNLATTDKTSIVGAVNELADQHHIEKVSDRKIILIADSYGGRPTLANSWIALAQASLVNLGATCYKAYGNGAGFSTVLKFSDVLDSLSGNVVNPEEITDIIVMGGVNEYGNTYGDILAGYTTFKNYCDLNYPNARTHIGICSLNGLGIEGVIINSISNSYKSVVQEKGGLYITNSELAFHDYSGLDGDHSHPNLLGSQMISDFLLNYIINGEVSTSYTSASPTVVVNTLAMSSLNMTMATYRNLFTITIKISLSDCSFTNPAPLSTPVKIGSIGWNGFVFGENPIITSLKARLVLDDNTLLNDQVITLYIDHGDIYLASYNNTDNIKALYGTEILCTVNPIIA